MRAVMYSNCLVGILRRRIRRDIVKRCPVLRQSRQLGVAVLILAVYIIIGQPETVHRGVEVKEDQDIYYDVGFNQKIQVNTVTTEVFTHDVQRDMDDFYSQSLQLSSTLKSV